MSEEEKEQKNFGGGEVGKKNLGRETEKTNKGKETEKTNKKG